MQVWIGNVRDDNVKMVELSTREDGVERCELVSGGPHQHCKVNSVQKERRHQSSTTIRKALS